MEIIGFPMHNDVVHDFLVAKDLLSSTSFQALAQTILIDYIGNISIILIIFALFL